MNDFAAWIASIATMTAAVITAAKLGTRITGWGFVVFTIGSIAWVVTAMLTGQRSLLLTNGFLTVVNAVGVWRWLGREAQHEKGSTRAALRSRRRPVPSLLSAETLIGTTVQSRDGKKIGSVIDAMLRCDAADIAYVVISDAGPIAIEETLRVVAPHQVELAPQAVTLLLSEAEFLALPAIAADDWPSAVASVRSTA